MTEAGHGSDVQHLQTTATYDPDTQEFVIDTPDDEAHKDYIGNAAQHGRMAAVFAQLIVGGRARTASTRSSCRSATSTGVAVRRRPDRGLRREDGPERRRQRPDLVRQRPRPARGAAQPLRRRRRAEGTYTSPIENANQRFFTMLGTLVQGRVCVSGASISAAKTALTIAVRYGLRRRQFGPPDGDEVPILDYRTHQRRLMPLLARTYALHFAQAELAASASTACSASADPPDRERRELESLAAAMKATASWHATRHDPDLPRVLRRRRLHGAQPVRRAEGRHRHLHHLRGRQHGADAARRQGRC